MSRGRMHPMETDSAAGRVKQERLFWLTRSGRLLLSSKRGPYARRSDINSPQVTSILTRWSVTRQAEAGEGCTNIELFSTDGIQNLIRLERILSVLSVFVVGYFFWLFSPACCIMRSSSTRHSSMWIRLHKPAVVCPHCLHLYR